MSLADNLSEAFAPLNQEGITYEQLQALPLNDIAFALNPVIAKLKAGGELSGEEYNLLSDTQRRIQELDEVLYSCADDSWLEVDRGLTSVFHRINEVLQHNNSPEPNLP